MIDPCEKQQKEYQSALNEEIKAKDIVNTPKRPLGKETPPPSNKSDIVVWKDIYPESSVYWVMLPGVVATGAVVSSPPMP